MLVGVHACSCSRNELQGGSFQALCFQRIAMESYVASHWMIMQFKLWANKGAGDVVIPRVEKAARPQKDSFEAIWQAMRREIYNLPHAPIFKKGIWKQPHGAPKIDARNKNWRRTIFLTQGMT